MIVFRRKYYLSLLTALAIAFAGSPRVKADDTDIYLNSALSPVDAPMIMINLDWGSSLGSTVCNVNPGNPVTNAQVAASCGWTPEFSANFTANDLSDGKIDRLDLLRAVMRVTMAGLDGVRVGLMLTHADTCSPGSFNSATGQTHNITGCSTGAYVAQGFELLEANDANGAKAALHAKLDAIPNLGAGNGHPFQGKEVYFEFYRYLTGQGIFTGHMGWQDYFDAPSDTNNLDVDWPAIAWDTSSAVERKVTGKDYYKTPFMAGASCTKVFALNFFFGTLGAQAHTDAAIDQPFSNGGLNVKVNIGNGEDQKFATVVQQMYSIDHADKTVFPYSEDIDGEQNVTSFFVVPTATVKNKAWAEAGGTDVPIVWDDDPEILVQKLRSIFSQILSVSTTFVSASVPVNVFNRAEFLDDVYIAIFEAEETGRPHWVGNVKKLKLQDDATGTFIGDVQGNPAFAADGRLDYNALTFWTDPLGHDMSDTSRYDVQLESATRDGRSVNRGGAGQQIPDFLNHQVGVENNSNLRIVYTEPATFTPGTPEALMDLDATAGVVQSLWDYLRPAGVYSSDTILNNLLWTSNDYANATAAELAEGLAFLKWVRGIDVNDDDNDGSTTDARPWLMADAIHSRPLTINYGARGSHTQDNPDVRVVVSTNEGMVHMLRNTDASGTEDGGEAWAFMPRYSLRLLNRLKNNTIGSPVHPYGVDGAPIAYTYDSDGDGTISGVNDKVYLYFGMRRGGRNYYALDISNPDDPQMLWSINNYTPGFDEMGLTFSRPVIAHLSYDTYTLKPVLIFGGGYDTNKDAKSADAQGTNDSMGRGIFIVDAVTGELIWSATNNGYSSMPAYADMLDSIPSDVTVLDSDGNGSVDRLYVGDTGGRIWRVDLAGTDRNAWKAQLFADLGRHQSAAKIDDIRFFHAPDVVQTRDSQGPYDAVVIGSGDRANPLDKAIDLDKIPLNWLFMMKDRKTQAGATLDSVLVRTDLGDLSDNCAQYVMSSCGTKLTQVDANGWMIEMAQRLGEKVLSRPLTINGVVFFTTYLPRDKVNPGAICEPDEGDGSLYAVDLYYARAVFDWDLTNNVTDATGEEKKLHSTDRYREAGHGIPADPIAIRRNGEIHVITPGDNYTTTLNMNSGYKTFWYVEGE